MSGRRLLTALLLATAVCVAHAQSGSDSSRVVKAALAGFRPTLVATVPDLGTRQVILFPRPLSKTDYIRSIPLSGPDSVYEPLAELIGGRVARGVELSLCYPPPSPGNNFCGAPPYPDGAVVVSVSDPDMSRDSARVRVLARIHPLIPPPRETSTSVTNMAWWIVLARDGADWKVSRVTVECPKLFGDC